MRRLFRLSFLTAFQICQAVYRWIPTVQFAVGAVGTFHCPLCNENIQRAGVCTGYLILGEASSGALFFSTLSFAGAKKSPSRNGFGTGWAHDRFMREHRVSKKVFQISPVHYITILLSASAALPFVVCQSNVRSDRIILRQSAAVCRLLSAVSPWHRTRCVDCHPSLQLCLTLA